MAPLGIRFAVDNHRSVAELGVVRPAAQQPGARPEAQILDHFQGQPADPDTIDRRVSESDTRKVEGFVEQALAGLEPEVVKAQVCMYSNTPDRHFLVGEVPGMERVTVLGGFSGHGFKFASVLGEVAADLATTGATSYPIELFTPARVLVGA